MQVLQDKKFFSETVYKATGQRSYYKLKEFSIYQHVPGIFPKSQLSWNATSAQKYTVCLGNLEYLSKILIKRITLILIWETVTYNNFQDTI